MQPHRLLRRLFAALEDRGVQWVLLRIPSDLERPPGDVDLLVAPRDIADLLELAQDVGFVPLPGWEAPPNLILVSYDKRSDHWIVLDVATTVSFRSPRSWELSNAADEVLATRRVRDGVAMPADEHAFWLLLAHCVLDRDAIPPHYWGRLRALAPGSSDSHVGRALVSAAGERRPPGDFEEAVLKGDWVALEAMGAQLASDLRRRRPLGESCRAAAKSTLRAVRKPLLLRRRRGVSVALLGPNGVGKSTLASGLRRSFPFGSSVIYMGLWKAAGGGRARRVLEALARPLRIWSRYAVARYQQARGRLVIYDRYVYEARLPAKPPLLAAKRFYFWLLGHALPRPDAAVVLDVDGRVAYARKQENPPEDLESERQVYALLAASEPEVELVDAARDPGAVRADVTEIIWRKQARRWRGRGATCEPAAG